MRPRMWKFASSRSGLRPHKIDQSAFCRKGGTYLDDLRSNVDEEVASNVSVDIMGVKCRVVSDSKPGRQEGTADWEQSCDLPGFMRAK